MAVALVGVVALATGSTPVMLTAPAQANAEPVDSQQVALDEAGLDDVALHELALTPPMGFNNWNSTACRDVFNEAFIKEMADLIVHTGLKDAGYEYINIDDCWARPQNNPLGSRDTDGHLVVDPNRFPNGIDGLADYIHANGMKFGIYHDAGTRTCNGQGFDGVLGPGYVNGNRRYEVIDAQDFAKWGVDLVKHDWCNVPLAQVPPFGGTRNAKARELYLTMREALNATGRKIVFQVATLGDPGVQPWEWAADIGAQYWRTTGDIRANYNSMSNIAKSNLQLARYAGPGHWNDPDMLQIGNGSWPIVEQRTHFSLWAIMAAPLLIGTDLRQATPEEMEILLNTDVIAIDQDALGVQGDLVRPVANGQYIVAKPLQNGDVAAALWNDTTASGQLSTTVTELGLPPTTGVYTVRDLWSKELQLTYDAVTAEVPAHATAMYRIGTRPDDKDDCKDGGWASFTDPSFRNQGDCVSWTNLNIKHLPQ
jgi:alpha-galactosidase